MPVSVFEVADILNDCNPSLEKSFAVPLYNCVPAVLYAFQLVGTVVFPAAGVSKEGLETTLLQEGVGVGVREGIPNAQTVPAVSPINTVPLLTEGAPNAPPPRDVAKS